MVAVRGRLAHQTADDFADVAAAESTFIGAIPATKPARTINDVATVNGDPDVVEAAVRQALHRGLARTAELLPAVAYLAALRAGVRAKAVERFGWAT